MSERANKGAGAARYAAKFRAPFAVLGIRTGRGAVTGVDYLPLSERAAAPGDALAERACRQVERYLDDGEFRFDLRSRRRVARFSVGGGVGAPRSPPAARAP